MATEHEHQSEHEEVHHESHSKAHNRKVKKHVYIPVIVLTVIVVALAAFLGWLYTGNVSTAKAKVFNAIPLPAAIVDMKFVNAGMVLDRIDLAKKLLAAQGLEQEANSADTYNQILDSKKLEAIANKKNLTISKADIDEEYSNIIDQYAAGDEEGFRAELQKTYEMEPEEFKNEVLRQGVINAQLMLWYNQQEDLNQESYKKINELKSRIDGGESFDDVARAFTEDEATKDFAGDSGTLAFDDLLPEFREALKDSKVDDVQMVPSRYGLHILKVLEVNNDGENGAKQIHLQQIFIKEKGFANWITKETDNIRVIELLKFS